MYTGATNSNTAQAQVFRDASLCQYRFFNLSIDGNKMDCSLGKGLYFMGQILRFAVIVNVSVESPLGSVCSWSKGSLMAITLLIYFFFHDFRSQPN